MPREIIELEDDILVEVEVSEEENIPISGGGRNITSTVDKIKPILLKLSRPIAESFKEISEDVQIEQAEIQVNFGFEGEGNIYITKVKGNANLSVKLTLKPKDYD